MTVFANGLEVAAKAQGNKVIAAFPDVCFTPPENPATPPGVPIPYPSFGTDSDTENGTGTVKIGGENITQKDKSDYSKTTGTEAGSAAKKGVISSTNTNKEYARAWSSNVKADGLPVSRFTDISTNNHTSSQVGNTPPQPKVGQPGPGSGSAPKTKCPCCGAIPAHANQVSASGEMCEQTTENEYYNDRMEKADAKIQQIEEDFAAGKLSKETHAAAWGQYQKRKKARKTIADARASGSKCKNLHDPPDKDCGIHFKGTRSYSEIIKAEDPAELANIEAKANAKYTDPKEIKAAIHKDVKKHVRETILGFKGAKKNDIKRRDGPGQVNHKTPLDAGGCPTSPDNLISDGALPPECKEIDTAQTTLQDISD
ncbi:DUF4150 domain-containing protein [Mesorhizobium sp. J8]|uniref:DUF4150 domain-containing protein n=1 Tax=Mesorhizobium sp. J8 TaxID=2777475 RepID=UPI0019151739|nr:DUF4150 domain-containing protein [Mesorhizobium sp. J8]BCM17231.1 hypothetical protein MJ8_09940 [Mesorhizobium sp. J8]